MRRPAPVLVRLINLVWLLLVTLAPGALAAETISADFDGDGLRDRAFVDKQEPSVIRVWLSRSRRIDVVRARTTISAIAASDLDGDRKAELIALGRSTDLQIWTRDRSGFCAFGSRVARNRALPAPDRRSVEPEPDGIRTLLPSPRVFPTVASSTALPGIDAPASASLTFFDGQVRYSGQRFTPSSPRSPPFRPL